MTTEEYKQLRTYARYDGIYLGVIWTASFACLIGMSAYPSLSMLCMAIALTTPFFVAMRLKKYRDEGLDGILPFNRALLYCFRVFLNAALLFAIVQWVYMRFIDQGRIAGMLKTMLLQDDAQIVLKQAGVKSDELIAAFTSISPLEFALTYFFENVVIGVILSIPIAFIMKRDQVQKK